MVLLTSGTLHETEQEAPATMCNSPPHKHSQASHCMHVYSPLLGNHYAWGGSMWRLLPSRFARSKWPPLHGAVVKTSISGDWYQVWAKVGEDIIVLQSGDPNYFWSSIPGLGKNGDKITVLQSGDPDVIWVWTRCSSLLVHWGWAKRSSHYVQLSST